MTTRPLHTQNPTRSDASTKIRLSILATAMVDALGGPAEFHGRFSFPLVTTMIPNKNFNLPPGVWTDDTSMTLCLARSLATFKGGFDEKDQLDADVNWESKGTLSAIGSCFDIGGTIRHALHIYTDTAPPEQKNSTAERALVKICETLSAENCAGNGSLMRVLPVGLAYWRNEEEAKEYARRSSMTTHPTLMCQEACVVWTGAIAKIMRETTTTTGLEEGRGNLTKLGVIEYFATFPYTNHKLRVALALPADALRGMSSLTADARETVYRDRHPIVQLIARMESRPPNRKHRFSKTIPSDLSLPSSGYVLHTLVAALYCFLATETFEEGAIMAVNLGNDADTVGAVYAGLAGCWYATESEQDGKGVFWTERVREWKERLVQRELVEEVAEELAEFSDSLETGRVS